MWGKFSVMKNLRIVENDMFSYMYCMSNCDSFIIQFHVNWRDFAFFKKTGWNEGMDNIKPERHYFT